MRVGASKLLQRGLTLAQQEPVDKHFRRVGMGRPRRKPKSAAGQRSACRPLSSPRYRDSRSAASAALPSQLRCRRCSGCRENICLRQANRSSAGASRLAHAARTMRCRLNFAVKILNLRAASDPVKYAEVVLTSTRSMKYVCGGPKEKRGLSPRHNLRAIYRRCWSS